jgi:hypothetical protein
MRDISPLSNDTDSSGESCILCLDSVDDKTIWFPTLYSSCECKYALHLACIKENKLDKCVVCNSSVSYPIPIQLIEKETFENISLQELRVDTTINTNRVVRHDNMNAQEEWDSRQVIVRRMCGVFLGFLLATGMVLLIWYVSTN